MKLNPGMRRMLCLVSAMILGGIVPALCSPSRSFFDSDTGIAGNIVPVMIVLMLFSSFIDVKFTRESTGWSHVRIPAAMVLIASLSFFCIDFFIDDPNHNFSVMAFLIGMTPTANAAPVITGLLGRRSDYVTISVVITNLFAAFSLAPLAALIVGSTIHVDALTLAWKTILIIGTPFSLAFLFRRFFPHLTSEIIKRKHWSFYLWMIMLFTVCAQSATYICKQENLSPLIIVEIFLLSAVMCFFNFFIGYCLGEKHFRRECSQSLGQKNTMLMLWIGLAFFNPIVALGPTFYVVCHNLWNSWQLRRADRNQSTLR